MTNISNLKSQMLTCFASIILLLNIMPAHAAVNLKLFETDSLLAIEQHRQGQPFVIVLWSIECPPCLKELKLLSRLKTAGLVERLVLVSTDGEEYRKDLESLISAERITEYEHWVFNDPMPERLRYNIDPAWYGELPRAYFYNSSGVRSAHSGVLTQATLEHWLAQEVSPTR